MKALELKHLRARKEQERQKKKQEDMLKVQDDMMKKKPMEEEVREASSKDVNIFKDWNSHNYVLSPLQHDVQMQRNRLRSEAIDKQQRTALMAVTFSDRRNHVIRLGTTVKRLLDLYPALKDPEEIWLEMSRMEGAVEAPTSKLKEYEARLRVQLDAAQVLTGCQDTDTVKIEAMMEYLLVNYSDVIVDDFRTPRSPFIRDGSVWVEGVKVFAFEEGTPLSVVLLTLTWVFPILRGFSKTQQANEKPLRRQASCPESRGKVSCCCCCSAGVRRRRPCGHRRLSHSVGGYGG
ncbi:hypothetical protein FJT64_021963 [Amphibalanus amphitrite]|uniref:Uncharacterized protein n=1 Tax=Amphibalanus amphitrite TaxID=1232801 RepID=A0A6A4WMS6_AMPAM|nr:hypothetical protein FJT64_021963 [Amphibalanus amphitrite]